MAPDFPSAESTALPSDGRLVPSASDSNIELTPSMLPSDENTIFEDSAFFTASGHTALPSPAQVRAVNPGLTGPRPIPPARFESLGLIVKYGQSVTMAEGQTLWAIRRLLPDIPVPEVYGWCRDGDEGFIYMELVQGVTLESHWENMTDGQRKDICTSLRKMIDSMRRLKQDPANPFIGQIGRQPLFDHVFIWTRAPSPGPFSSVPEFHDLFGNLRKPYNRTPDDKDGYWRPQLDDAAYIAFTHGDLHRSNIIVSTGDNPQIVGLIDWQQAGWFPDYWEACKAHWTADHKEEWATKYLPMIVDLRMKAYYPWEAILSSMGI